MGSKTCIFVLGFIACQISIANTRAICAGRKINQIVGEDGTGTTYICTGSNTLTKIRNIFSKREALEEDDNGVERRAVNKCGSGWSIDESQSLKHGGSITCTEGGLVKMSSFFGKKKSVDDAAESTEMRRVNEMLRKLIR
uniref:Cnidarian restricted protein n=1 Tax=Clytia hemisphaerica TaxID=252671 RepID=A0A7M5UWA8_9CNID